MKTDEQLYAEMQRGRRAAFDELYARYELKLFGFIRAYLKNEQDAEEIFHDAMRALIDAKALSQKVAPWLFTVARNACLNRLRAQRATVRVSEELADGTAAAVDTLILKRRHVALCSAVDELPTKLNEVYKMRTAGASYEDMAQRLGVPLGTIKSRVNALVRRLREDMELWLP